MRPGLPVAAERPCARHRGGRCQRSSPREGRCGRRPCRRAAGRARRWARCPARTEPSASALSAKTWGSPIFTSSLAENVPAAGSAATSRICPPGPPPTSHLPPGAGSRHQSSSLGARALQVGEDRVRRQGGRRSGSPARAGRGSGRRGKNQRPSFFESGSAPRPHAAARRHGDRDGQRAGALEDGHGMWACWARSFDDAHGPVEVGERTPCPGSTWVSQRGTSASRLW